MSRIVAFVLSNRVTNWLLYRNATNEYLNKIIIIIIMGLVKDSRIRAFWLSDLITKFDCLKNCCNKSTDKKIYLVVTRLFNQNVPNKIRLSKKMTSERSSHCSAYWRWYHGPYESIVKTWIVIYLLLQNLPVV